MYPILSYGIGIKCVVFGLQVKVKSWVGGEEDTVYEGMTAVFGSPLPQKIDQASKYPALFSVPEDCCALSTAKVSHPLLFTYISFSIHYFNSSFPPPSCSYLDRLLSVNKVPVTSQLKLTSRNPPVPLLY